MVRATGCCITGATNNVQVHHIVGRKGKHNKILIGPYFIIPIHEDYHMITGAHPNAWHKNKKGFIEEFGLARDLFRGVIASLEDSGVSTSDFVSDECIEAIMDCRI